jgi:hypothetical protein
VRDFPSREEARGWVCEQAKLLRVAVKWLEEAPEWYGGRLRMRGEPGLDSASWKNG